MKRPCLLIFGLGYTANALVDYLKDENWEVWGTTRTASTANLLRKKNIKAQNIKMIQDILVSI